MKTHHLNECRSCGGMSIGEEERVFCEKCLKEGDKIPRWVSVVSLIASLIVVLMMSSCSENDPQPTDCETLKLAYEKEWTEYNEILKIKLVMPTLKQQTELQDAQAAAQEDFRKAKVLYENCHN